MDGSSDLHVAGPVPAFRSVLRGYDPDDVRVALDELRTSLAEATREVEEQAARRRSAERTQEDLEHALAEAQSRLAESEREGRQAPTASFESLGTRIEQILQGALEEAEEITGRARVEAQALSDEAQAAAVTSRIETDHYASDVRAGAVAEAEAVRQRAQVDAERLLADARAVRETQQRAHAESYERATAELADRQVRAEAEMAEATARHEHRLALLTARIEAASGELAASRERSEAEAEGILHAARTAAAESQAQVQAQRADVIRTREEVRRQLAEVRTRLQNALPETVDAGPSDVDTAAAGEPDGPRRRARIRRRHPFRDGDAAEH